MQEWVLLTYCIPGGKKNLVVTKKIVTYGDIIIMIYI